MRIAPMNESHLSRVIEIEDAAWKAAKTPLGRRTVTNVRHALAINPTGCFVAIDNEETVGFIFSRCWGSVGFLGMFAMHPDHAMRGYGRRLFETCLESMLAARPKVIGLETMAESAYNVGMYLKLGFRMAKPTMVFVKDSLTGCDAGAVRVCRLNEIRTIGNAVFEGLDHSGEMYEDNAWLGIDVDGELAGYAVLQRNPTREGPRDTLNVYALVLTECSPELLARAIDQIEGFGNARGFTKLVISLNASNPEAVDTLFALGFRLQRIAARMCYGGVEYIPRRGIDCSRWVM